MECRHQFTHIYIDVVSASRVHMVLAEKGLKPALAYATVHLLSYLTLASFVDGHVSYQKEGERRLPGTR